MATNKLTQIKTLFIPEQFKELQKQFNFITDSLESAIKFLIPFEQPMAWTLMPPTAYTSVYTGVDATLWYSNPEYRKDPLGVVRLRGLVTTNYMPPIGPTPLPPPAIALIVGQLPEGCRPSKNIVQPVISIPGNYIIPIKIEAATGYVSFTFLPPNIEVYDLSAISFDTRP